MGAAAFKNSKSSSPNQAKNETKNITIGVFGLDDAGKTSTVKVIEGESTENIAPTIGSVSTTVANPLNEKKNKKQQTTIRIIDVSGERRFRQKSWSQYYDQMHGFIFVIDASSRKRLNENQEILEDLLANEKLKNKPILILANKQDQKGAISKEHDLKRQLDIEKLKSKHKIELCTALPKTPKNKVNESIRKGFVWLIQTIDENYAELNVRVSKSKNAPRSRFPSDENDSDTKYSKTKPTHYRSNITSEKLPSINTNKTKTKVYSDDDDDDYSPSKNEMNKKSKLLGGTNSKSNDNELKAFRATYESFPEETPWATAMLKPTKSTDTLPRLHPKTSGTNDMRKRDVSPLVHDTKLYTNGSRAKPDENIDDDEDYLYQQKSKSTTRFTSNVKQPTASLYNENNTRRIITTPKKTYNDDEDEDNYLKKSTSTTKLSKNYDFDEDKIYQRSTNGSNYRGTSTHPGNYSKYDTSSSARKETSSRFDDEDYYSTSKPITRSAYNNDYSKSTKHNDDEDDHRWSPSKTTNNSRFNDDDYSSSKLPTRSFSSSKPKSHSKFEDDDYPTSSSKPTTHSRYNDDNDDDDYRYPSSSTKAVPRSKYDDDDDDDDYRSSSKKNNPRSRFDNDDFFTNKPGSNSGNRFQKTTDYDS